MTSREELAPRRDRLDWAVRVQRRIGLDEIRDHADQVRRDLGLPSRAEEATEATRQSFKRFTEAFANVDWDGIQRALAAIRPQTPIFDQLSKEHDR